MEKQILYTLPADAEAEQDEVYRLTVGEAKVLHMVRYRRLAREAWSWLEEQGIAKSELGDTPEDAPPGENFDLMDVVLCRAYMLATLLRVERGTCGRDDAEPSEWHEATLPAEWEGIDGFVAHVPGALFAEWQRVALECNPDVFFLSLTEKKRRRGGVIVT